MATVRFSDALKDTVRTNAKKMFEENIRKTVADYPSTWADKFYNTFFPADVIAKFNALPDYAMDKKERIDFRGFTNAPEDVWQTGEYKHDTWKLMIEIPLNFSTAKPWPHKFNKEDTGYDNEWRGGYCNYNDSRWDWLKDEFKEYNRKVFEIESKQAKFMEGVNKIMDTYSTLAPALKAWQPLWDLLDDNTKERHKKVVERKKSSDADLGVNLNDMTAAVTFSKLTR